MAMISLTPSGGVAPAPGTVVLKADEYARLIEAERLLDAAAEKAAAIVAEAEKTAVDMRREGFERGVREGRDEVAGQFIEAVAASVEQLAGMETALVDVVVRSLKTILGSFDREDLARQVVGHALRLVRDEKRVTLRVAPGDADAVEANLKGILERYPGLVRVDVVPDASIASGGCVMETELGVIDATLDRQLAIIEDALRGQLEGRKE